MMYSGSILHLINYFCKHFIFIIFLALPLCIACTDISNNAQSQIDLPNTPEAVSKQWQLYLDNNEIEKVAALSTQKTKVWLQENKELFLNDPQLYKTNFIQMQCSVNQDTAICHFTLQEAGELIEDYFLLKKENGQWLVDLDDETDIPGLEEQFFKEMEKELKLSR